MPPEFEALLNAYREASGYDVKMSYHRENAVKEIHSRGITPEDVRAVMLELKRRIDRGVKGYCDSSLGFRNAMEDVDRLEERVLMIRQRIARAKGSKPKPDVQHERQVGDVKFRVLGPPAEVPPEDSANVLPGALRELAKGLERQAS